MDSKNNDNNISNNEELLYLIKKIKSEADKERKSYETFFAPLKEFLSSLTFKEENNIIQHNLGLANRLCHIIFENNNIADALSKIQSQPDIYKNQIHQKQDFSEQNIYGLESNLNHHKSVEELEWLKSNASILSTRTWGRQFIYKFLRPFLNVQYIFNENLIGMIGVLINTAIQERKALLKLGEEVQSFNSSVVRCLNEWVQKDIKKEMQLQIFLSNFISSVFQFVKGELSRYNELVGLIEELKFMKTQVNESLLSYSNQLRKEYELILKKESDGIREEINSFFNKNLSDFNNASENFQSILQGYQKDISAAIEHQREVLDDLTKHIHSTTEKISKELREQNIKALKAESQGLRLEQENFSQKIKSDIYQALENHRSIIDNDLDEKNKYIKELTQHLQDTMSKITNDLQNRFIDTLKTESAGIRSEIENYKERALAEVYELVLKEQNDIAKKVEDKLSEKFTIYVERLNDLIQKVQTGGLTVSNKGEKVSPLPKEDSGDIKIGEDFDFYAFEEWSRGTEERIREEQKIYLPFFRGRKKVLDLGCGRGEFLELLYDNEIPSYGIDIDSKMVLHCVNKKLNVQLEDIFTHLEKIEEGEVDGIFAAQVVEHLKISELKKLSDISYNKLASGGIVIFETINPCCLSTYTGALYADPTHQKPVHPTALQFFLEKAGFTNCQIVFSVPIPPEHKLEILNLDNILEKDKGLYTVINRNFEKLNSILYTYAHYAIVAHKKG